MAHHAATALIDNIRRELQPLDEHIRNHPYLEALEAGWVPPAALHGFAGHQHYIIGSDLRSLALLLHRFGSGSPRAYLAGLLQGESEAARALGVFAGALGLDRLWLESFEPQPGGAAYAAQVAWLCAYGALAELAGAFLVNLAAWGANCGRMAAALERHYSLAPSEVEFFRLFAQGSEVFEHETLELIEADLSRGAEPRLIRRAARLLQEYELLYWDTMNSY